MTSKPHTNFFCRNSSWDNLDHFELRCPKSKENFLSKNFYKNILENGVDWGSFQKFKNTTNHFEMKINKSLIQIKVELFYNYEDLLQLHKIARSDPVHGFIEKIKLSIKIPLAVFLVVVPVYVIILERFNQPITRLLNAETDLHIAKTTDFSLESSSSRILINLSCRSLKRCKCSL